MALRTFVDSAGNEWHAYTVVPRDDERRRADRRSISGSRDTREVERRDSDRRLTVGRQARFGSAAQGWVCFEHGTDRRRLFPIPDNWDRCGEGDLEVYFHSARQVRRNSVSLQQLRDR